MTVAVVALVFSMAGNGIAAKSLLTGKQIKDGSITNKDLAKGAVKAKQIAKGAVTPDKLATGAVTGRAVARDSIDTSQIVDGTLVSIDLRPDNAVELSQLSSFTNPVLDYYSLGAALTTIVEPPFIDQSTVVCADGSSVLDASLCAPPPPAPVYTRVSAKNVDMQQLINNCYIRTSNIPWPGDGIIAQNYFMWSRSPNHDSLVAPKNGLYTVTADAVWAQNANGTSRVIDIRKIYGPALHDGISYEGQHTILQTVTAQPSAADVTNQTATIQIPLFEGDSVAMQGGSCGANVTIQDASLSMERTGD